MGAPHLSRRIVEATSKRRDLSQVTLDLIEPVLTYCGVTLEQWIAGEPSRELTIAWQEATVVLREACYCNAAIARALGVDDRTVSRYLQATGLLDEKEQAPAPPPPPAEELVLPGPTMLAGPGVRHDCELEGECLKSLLKASRLARKEPPRQAHCPQHCPDRVAPDRHERMADAMRGPGRQPGLWM